MAVVVLHAGRDRSVRRRHPWVLAGAVARVDGPAGSGAEVEVVSAEGERLGFGDLSPRSSLRVRMWWFGKELPPDDWLESRVTEALARRAGCPLLADGDARALGNPGTNEIGAPDIRPDIAKAR